MLIPNSAASKIIGRDGCHAREMAQQIGCRTSISRRNPGGMLSWPFRLSKWLVDLEFSMISRVEVGL